MADIANTDKLNWQKFTGKCQNDNFLIYDRHWHHAFINSLNIVNILLLVQKPANTVLVIKAYARNLRKQLQCFRKCYILTKNSMYLYSTLKIIIINNNISLKDTWIYKTFENTDRHLGLGHYSHFGRRPKISIEIICRKNDMLFFNI